MQSFAPGKNWQATGTKFSSPGGRGKDFKTRGDGAKAAGQKVLPSGCFGALGSPPRGVVGLNVTNVIFITSVVLSKL
jgi:hypothetical protein